VSDTYFFIFYFHFAQIVGMPGFDPQSLSKIFRKLKFYKVLLVAARESPLRAFPTTVRIPYPPPSVS